MNQSLGVKFYHDPKIRDEAMRLQTLGYEAGLAPSVGQKIDMPWLEGWKRPSHWTHDVPTVYGYVTQIVDLIDASELAYEEFRVEQSNFKRMLRDNGLSTDDLGYYNLGRINGKLVRHDWDPMFYKATLDQSWRLYAEDPSNYACPI